MYISSTFAAPLLFSLTSNPRILTKCIKNKCSYKYSHYYCYYYVILPKNQIDGFLDSTVSPKPYPPKMQGYW